MRTFMIKPLDIEPGPVRLTKEKKKVSKLDIFLNRTSHIVQIGLFSVTLFTVYYTVIPLYKNAQMEESLARKELELDKLNQATEDLYKKVRDMEAGSLASTTIRCTNLLDEKLEPSRKVMLDIDIPTCLNKLISEHSYESLRELDKLTLKDHARDIATKVAALQAEYRAKRDSLADEIRNNPAIAESIKSQYKKDNENGLNIALFDLLKGLGMTQEQLDSDRDSRLLEIGKSQIENKFSGLITKELIKIKDVRWPTS